MMKRLSNKIDGLTFKPCGTLQNSVQYEMGFSAAKDKASRIAHKYDMLMARMAGALEEVDLENPAIVQALGISTSFNIGTALRMYRELHEHQTTEGEPTP